MDAEHRRVEEARAGDVPWRKWGPYLAERQWGTVREDYSESGDAWNYFSHDRLGVKTVFVLNDEQAAAKGIANIFEATAKKIGLANEGIDWKQPHQKPVLTKVGLVVPSVWSCVRPP